jgi:S2P endopeptidase
MLRDSIPLISVGASLFVFLPTTFVKLSSVALNSLLPAGRIRVIAAGSFHNLLLWSLLIVLCKSGIGTLLWSIPYRNISSLGRVVTNVEPVSWIIDYTRRLTRKTSTPRSMVTCL